MRILFILLLLTGCATQEPMPEAGTYNVALVFVDSDEEVRALCEDGSGRPFNACTQYRSRIVLNRHTWLQLMDDGYSLIEHEVMHVLGFDHDEKLLKEDTNI